MLNKPPLTIGNLARRKVDEVRDLQGLHILIVEDDWLLAGDLARYFGNMGAVVLGPAATVEQASTHTDTAEAAILDVNLNGRRVFPIADELMRRGVPFVFFSGDEDIVIPERLRHASNLRKSSDSYAIFDALFPPERSALAGRPPVNLSDNVFSLLPKLRLAARLLLGDVGASDRLVERTLESAIGEIDRRRVGVSTEDWLNGIMRSVARSSGTSLLH
ncbi:MAG: response regulator [Mesorhizobium sp.]|uniref:Response regulator n=1 Tax=Mesorhizobium mediterraneum TaxID=43617 RepID=A0AB36R6J5_9HYPH|nr:response regulator [Mesorhizobium mediterraneum]RUU31521.1 response regulator [Mesorhizobium sp. M6A.T.Ce.TU.016.01.1.1]RUU42413.1 response regulator [Mesorhizobium sp. M6A.T.Ca.TU.002.02.2.1]RUU46886.1 response regulator [Mesorhizobium sp. M6A.T.Ce.TU.002.03.1.1]RUU95927.1 response regulator [Mesorhizobium sp. M6A.T.Cr.TU.017.01.1.1]RVB80338.1 response regulator [Mesorhizobium sp. M6A.T.Cr.TU.014.01.1.1]RWN37120.1 MAG: response regulator [Mesorhizobium sp.]